MSTPGGRSPVVLRALVESGKQEAAGFLSLPWVVEQFSRGLGIVPFPGTLNLRLRDPASLSAWEALRQAGGSEIRPAEGFCPASCYPVLVNGCVPGAIVLPHVQGYPDDVVEVVAAEGLRARFGLADGDECVLTPSEACAP